MYLRDAVPVCARDAYGDPVALAVAMTSGDVAMDAVITDLLGYVLLSAVC